jgi:hypothetical protein
MNLCPIEVGVVGPALLRHAVVSLLSSQPDIHIAEPSSATVWVEINTGHCAPGVALGWHQFILVGTPHQAEEALRSGAYIGFDESSSVLCEAIFAVAGAGRGDAVGV